MIASDGIVHLQLVQILVVVISTRFSEPICPTTSIGLLDAPCDASSLTPTTSTSQSW